LDETIEAFPVSVHPVVPLSNPRFGKAQYASGSLHGVKGYDVAPHGGNTELVRLAEAAGTESAAAATSTAEMNHRCFVDPIRYLAIAAGTVGSS
jgi:hypothetical protein